MTGNLLNIPVIQYYLVDTNLLLCVQYSLFMYTFCLFPYLHLML